MALDPCIPNSKYQNQLVGPVHSNQQFIDNNVCMQFPVRIGDLGLASVSVAIRARLFRKLGDFEVDREIAVRLIDSLIKAEVKRKLAVLFATLEWNVSIARNFLRKGLVDSA